MTASNRRTAWHEAEVPRLRIDEERIVTAINGERIRLKASRRLEGSKVVMKKSEVRSQKSEVIPCQKAGA